MRKYIFLVGTGRIASFYITHFVKENVGNLFSCHEPNRLLKVISNLYVSGKISENRAEKYLRSFKRSVDKRIDRENVTVYFQSDPWIFGLIGFLEKVFSAPFVVHIVRNPVTYIPSQLNMFYNNKLYGLLRDIIPYWKLRGYMTGDYPKREWNSFPLHLKTAWYWNFVNNYIEKNKGKLSNYAIYKYEELFSDGKLEDMLNFCGVELEITHFNNSFLNTKRNLAPKKFEPLNENEIESVKEMCFDLMRQYGYI